MEWVPFNLMSVEQIKTAIEQLSLKSGPNWRGSSTAGRSMSGRADEAGCRGGKFDDVLREADEDIATGRLRDLHVKFQPL